jgi:HSP20 family molecular chaperone IbpA
MSEQLAEPEAEWRYIPREQPGGPMSRNIEFPSEIDSDNIEARLEHGILKIKVRKAVAGRRKVVKLV